MLLYSAAAMKLYEKFRCMVVLYSGSWTRCCWCQKKVPSSDGESCWLDADCLAAWGNIFPWATAELRLHYMVGVNYGMWAADCIVHVLILWECLDVVRLTWVASSGPKASWPACVLEYVYYVYILNVWIYWSSYVSVKTWRLMSLLSGV